MLLKIPGLQNTSMYSALWASHRLLKFDPIEFSPLRFIQTAKQSNEVQVARENLDALVGCNSKAYCNSSNLIMVDYG